MRWTVLALHTAVLLCFGLGALRVFLPPASVPLPPPPREATFPLLVELRFVAAHAMVLEALAPAPLRAAIAEELRAQLRLRASADADCMHTWLVHTVASVLPTDAAGGGALRVERPAEGASPRRLRPPSRSTFARGLRMRTTRRFALCRPIQPPLRVGLPPPAAAAVHLQTASRAFCSPTAQGSSAISPARMRT